MIINWLGNSTDGYGDIISPLCYAQNQYIKRSKIIRLCFYWSYKKETNDKYDSPHNLINSIYNHFNFDGVIIDNIFLNHSKPPNSIVFSNDPLKKINGLSKYHNVYFPVKLKQQKHIVVCTPINNKQDFNVYHKGIRIWKQYHENEKWIELINQPNTIHIDYKTPVEQSIDILYDCKMFIGYHGSCAWLARLMGIPMKIYTNNLDLSSYVFPWDSFNEENIPYEQNVLNLENAKIEYQQYVESIRGSRS